MIACGLFGTLALLLGLVASAPQVRCSRPDVQALAVAYSRYINGSWTQEAMRELQVHLADCLVCQEAAQLLPKGNTRPPAASCVSPAKERRGSTDRVGKDDTFAEMIVDFLFHW